MSRWLPPLLLLVLFEMVADIFAKEYTLRKSFWIALGALLFYVVCNSFWLMALKSGVELSRGAVLFSVMSAILACGIGVGWYKEELSVSEWVGALLGLVALVLLAKC